MTFYVEFRKINGRAALAELASEFLELGLNDVEYYGGGWQDKSFTNILPHLKFENEQDATIYILRYGGTISKTVPYYIIAGG